MSASTRPLRSEFLTGKVFASIEEAQAALGAAIHYNHESIGMVAPFERFRLVERRSVETGAQAPAPAQRVPSPTVGFSFACR